jgi:hypothetical protein
VLGADKLVLEAIAAESMPQRWVVSGVGHSSFFELRDYGISGLSPVLEHHGIRTILEEDGMYLFPFDSLYARERAWREVSVDREWMAIQACPRQIVVYKASSYK